MWILTRAVLTFLIYLSALADFGCGSRLPPVTSTNSPTARPPAQSSQPDFQQVVSKIRDIVAKHLGIEPSGVDVEAPLSKQKVAADELDVVEIILNVEDAFGIKIQDEEVSDANAAINETVSVRKLAEIVISKKNPKR